MFIDISFCNSYPDVNVIQHTFHFEYFIVNSDLSEVPYGLFYIFSFPYHVLFSSTSWTYKQYCNNYFNIHIFLDLFLLIDFSTGKAHIYVYTYFILGPSSWLLVCIRLNLLDSLSSSNKVICFLLSRVCTLLIYIFSSYLNLEHKWSS